MKTWFPAFLIAVIMTLTQGLAAAQQPAKVPRIGYLGLNDPSSHLFESFRKGLREVGYIEGQNIIIEPRFAYGNNWRLKELASSWCGSTLMSSYPKGHRLLSATMSATTVNPHCHGISW